MVKVENGFGGGLDMGLTWGDVIWCGAVGVAGLCAGCLCAGCRHLNLGFVTQRGRVAHMLTFCGKIVTYTGVFVTMMRGRRHSNQGFVTQRVRLAHILTFWWKIVT